jgi:hypothetical protein
MLKKKRKCKRKKEEGNPQNIIGQMTPSMMTSYKQSRTSASITPYKSTVTSMVRVYGGRHPTRLTQNVLGSISIYGKSF